MSHLQYQFLSQVVLFLVTSVILILPSAAGRSRLHNEREKLDENINRSCRLIENSVVLQPSDSVSGILEDFLDHIRLVHVVRAKLQIALQKTVAYLLLLRVNELHEIRDAAERCQNGPVKLAVLLDEGESCVDRRRTGGGPPTRGNQSTHSSWAGWFLLGKRIRPGGNHEVPEIFILLEAHFCSVWVLLQHGFQMKVEWRGDAQDSPPRVVKTVDHPGGSHDRTSVEFIIAQGTQI